MIGEQTIIMEHAEERIRITVPLAYMYSKMMRWWFWLAT